MSCLLLAFLAGSGMLMVKTAPGRSVRLPAAIVPPIASTKPRHIARPSPVPARTLSPFRHAVELVEDPFQIFRPGCPGPSSRTCSVSALSSPNAWMRMLGTRDRNIWPALSSRLNSTCSNSTGSTLTIGRSGGRSTSTRWYARIFRARRKRGADDVVDIVEREIRLDRAGFDPGHVEQIGDEAVEPLGLRR